jgi:hypothetical protein
VYTLLVDIIICLHNKTTLLVGLVGSMKLDFVNKTTLENASCRSNIRLMNYFKDFSFKQAVQLLLARLSIVCSIVKVEFGGTFMCIE